MVASPATPNIGTLYADSVFVCEQCPMRAIKFEAGGLSLTRSSTLSVYPSPTAGSTDMEVAGPCIVFPVWQAQLELLMKLPTEERLDLTHLYRYVLIRYAAECEPTLRVIAD